MGPGWRDYGSVAHAQLFGRGWCGRKWSIAHRASCTRGPETRVGQQTLPCGLGPYGIEWGWPNRCSRMTLGDASSFGGTIAVYGHQLVFIRRAGGTPYCPQVRANCEPEQELTLEVKPCEAKPKNVGGNFASGLLLSKTQTGSLPQFRSYFRYWRNSEERRQILKEQRRTTAQRQQVTGAAR